jgi:putative colanic acid biosynthesis acetyltransferase WcaF
MTEPLEIVDHTQSSQFVSPWPVSERVRRALWELCWFIVCCWTPKPANLWRLFWLGVFDAKIEGTPFVHQRARIALPWNLTLLDRSCLGDRVNVYSLGEIEIGARAVVAQEAYLNTGSHDFSRPGMPLVVAKITIGEDAFVGARAFVMPGVKIGARAIVGACSVVTRDVPENVVAAGNPCRILHPRNVNQPPA